MYEDILARVVGAKGGKSGSTSGAGTPGANQIGNSTYTRPLTEGEKLRYGLAFGISVAILLGLFLWYTGYKCVQNRSRPGDPGGYRGARYVR